MKYVLLVWVLNGWSGGLSGEIEKIPFDEKVACVAAAREFARAGWNNRAKCIEVK